MAPESGVEFRPMAPVSGAGFWSVCQGPYTRYLAVEFECVAGEASQQSQSSDLWQ